MKKLLHSIVAFICFSQGISAQWQPTTGIYGADVRCSIVKDSIIFIGTGNGVYASSNNGQTWTNASNGLSKDYVYSLALSGTNIYAGTGYGVFLSSDNGQNWTPANNGLINLNVSTLIVNNGKMYAATGQGVFISTDNGANWSNNNSITSAVLSLTANGNFLFAATWDGVKKSADGGISWTSVGGGFPNFERTNTVAMLGTKIVAGTNKNVFLSTNNGENWSNIGFNENILMVALRGNDIFVGTINGLFFSANNGDSWTSSSEGLNKNFFFTVCFKGTTVITGTLGSVFIANNYGDIWRESYVGLTNAPVSSFATDGNQIFAGNRFPNVFKMPINGNTWTNTTNNLKTATTNTFNVRALAVNGSNVFAGTDQFYCLSNNNGDSWSINNSLNSVESFSIKGSNVYAGTSFGLSVSSDNGSNWALRSNELRNLRVTNLKTIGNNMYATTLFTNSNSSAVYTSINNGDSWSNIYSVSTTGVTSVTAIDSNVFIGTFSGVILAKNNRNSWTNVGLTSLTIMDITVNNNNIYAATYNAGIFMSNNNGTNWKAVNEGLPTKNILKVIVAGNYLFAATDIGVFKRPLTELTVKNSDIKEESNCTISPNPVANTLTINASNYLIGNKYAIQNILGETIQTDVLKHNSTELNVQNLSHGIYFLHLIGTNKTVKFVKE
jgi:hypothetical protein